MKGQLCYSCFDHTTYQYHGQTPDAFHRELKRYLGALTENVIVECYLCDRKVQYYKAGATQVWRERTL